LILLQNNRRQFVNNNQERQILSTLNVEQWLNFTETEPAIL